MLLSDEVKRLTFEQLLCEKDRDIWLKSFSIELGRLTQGNMHGLTSTDTIEFIYKNQVLSTKKVTYGQCARDYRPLKPKKNRVRCVVGGDKLHCFMDSGAQPLVSWNLIC